MMRATTGQSERETALRSVEAHVVPVTPLMQNCTLFLCRETKEAVIVDPGGDVSLIIEALERTGAEPVAIWLTHGHFDHAGGAPALKRQLDVPILGPHADDAWLTTSIAEQERTFGVFVNGEDFEPDRWLKDGEVLSFGRVRFMVRHCPGHTPGHVLFINEADRIGQFGDVLFAGSIGRTDFPRGDHELLLENIARIILPLPDDFLFIPGHGPASTVGEERRSNPFLQGLSAG